MTKVSVVQVFVDDNGNFGSPTGIVVDESKKLTPEQRQDITKQAGFSETVFINDLKAANVSVFSLTGEIPFAGAPLLGAAWFIEQKTGKLLESLTSQNKQIRVKHDEGFIWIVLDDLSILPNWTLENKPTPGEVENINASSRPSNDHSLVWAWIDRTLRDGAKVRARTFAPGWDIPEEEANGSGSMLLAHTLGRNLLIKHGKGSIIRAVNSGDRSTVAIGGKVVEGKTLNI